MPLAKDKIDYKRKVTKEICNKCYCLNEDFTINY